VEDRRVLTTLFAVLAVVLIAAFIYGVVGISFDQMDQQTQDARRSDESKSKSARSIDTGDADKSSIGAHAQREDSGDFDIKKEPQDTADCTAPANAVGTPLRCTTLEADLALVLHKKKPQDVVIREGERRASPAEKRSQEEQTAKTDAERQAADTEKERQDAKTELEGEGLTLEAEKKRRADMAAQKDAERQAAEAQKKRQDAAAKLEAERSALEAEKARQQAAVVKIEAERLAVEAEKARQQQAAEKIEAERLVLEAEKMRQQEAAAKNEAERLALEAEIKRQTDVIAQKDAQRQAADAEKKQQEEVAKSEAKRLATEPEQTRQEEAARMDAERASLSAEEQIHEGSAAPSPNAVKKAPANQNADQQIVVWNIAEPAPASAANVEFTGTLKPSPLPRGAADTPVPLDLPAFAPPRVALTYPRNDKLAAERMTALRQALTTAKVDVVKVEAVEASRPTAGLGYYFRSDHDAAVDLGHRFQSLLGPVEPALLEIHGMAPPPGTIELAVPGRSAR
jgi:trimeric autotransporter adhesin